MNAEKKEANTRSIEVEEEEKDLQPSDQFVKKIINEITIIIIIL